MQFLMYFVVNINVWDTDDERLKVYWFNKMLADIDTTTVYISFHIFTKESTFSN